MTSVLREVWELRNEKILTKFCECIPKFSLTSTETQQNLPVPLRQVEKPNGRRGRAVPRGGGIKNIRQHLLFAEKCAFH